MAIAMNQVSRTNRQPADLDRMTEIDDVRVGMGYRDAARK
jgi:hypothetical protein